MSSTQGETVTDSIPAAPPTPQEILRKLSVHQKPTKPRTAPAPQVSGTESDSDTVLSPDLSPLVPHASGGHFAGGSSQPPLSSIAERDTASGDESDEDDEDDGEGAEWRNHIQPRTHENSVIKAGYLWKKGERRKTWKKRWFVLRPAHLAFYKSSAEYQLLRLLELSDVHACTHVDLKRHANSFGVVSPTRTYYLQAQSASDVEDWVRKLNEAREAVMATTTQNSLSSAPIPIPKSPKASSTFPTITPSPPSMNAITSESESDDAHSYQPGTSYQSQVVTFSPSKGPSVSKDPTKVILSGYLMKCRSKRRAWRKRWFVLTGEKLTYSASHMEPKRLRVIELPQVVDALECDLPVSKNSGHSTQSPLSPGSSALGPKSPEGEDGSTQHTFKIITAKRSLLLCAPSEEEEIKWLSAVRALIARRSGPNSVGSPPSGGASAIRATVSSGGALGGVHRTPSAAGPQGDSLHVQSGSGHSRKLSFTGRTRSASGASFGAEAAMVKH